MSNINENEISDPNKIWVYDKDKNLYYQVPKSEIEKSLNKGIITQNQNEKVWVHDDVHDIFYQEDRSDFPFLGKEEKKEEELPYKKGSWKWMKESIKDEISYQFSEWFGDSYFAQFSEDFHNPKHNWLYKTWTIFRLIWEVFVYIWMFIAFIFVAIFYIIKFSWYLFLILLAVAIVFLIVWICVH